MRVVAFITEGGVTRRILDHPTRRATQGCAAAAQPHGPSELPSGPSTVLRPKSKFLSNGVTVRTTAEGRGRIEILDSGPGIPPEVESQLFTPFFTTKPDGQGLGLTFVHEVLAAHGFDFSLAGPPGGPTRFGIRL